MQYTGERIIPKVMNPKSGLLLEHLFRYRFARKFCRGRVLDIACGVGYGSEILFKKNPAITEYVGIDHCQESIDYGNKHYKNYKTSYFADDALNKNLHTLYGRFDTIISFETIEHFNGDVKFIQNLYNLLKSNGTLIISTPFGKGKDQPCSNPYHVFQYTEDEFMDILNPFSSITMYHQLDNTIEIPKPNKKYYLMVAVCKK
ncbi:class I SAM-dependent methyltransferase [Anaerosolibacter sp.]|uniref:class I SAM-dependent methyltransferase n=1 Tax=Anaerosolibacter sp. TaxID=1872527 RepID=UPI0039EE4A78